MAQIIELKLATDEVVELELGYNPFKCMMIAKDFPQVNNVFTVAVGEEVQELDFATMSQAVYVAYRQANLKKALSFEDFYNPEKGWEFDLDIASNVYVGMLDKNSAKEYAESLAKLAKKGKKGK